MAQGGQRHAPAALPSGKTRYPLYRRLGGPRGRSGQVQNISPPTGILSPDRPAGSESLYWLSYPGPQLEPIVQEVQMLGVKRHVIKTYGGVEVFGHPL